MDLHTLVQKYKQLRDETGKEPSYYELMNFGVTEYSIKKHGGMRKLKKLVGTEKDFSESDEPPPLPSVEPKVLVLDLELAPIEAYVWGLRDQNIGLNQIKKDWFIMSFAAKWLGAPENEIIYHDIRHTPDNDETLLGYLWQLFDEADFILTQNGKI